MEAGKGKVEERFSPKESAMTTDSAGSSRAARGRAHPSWHFYWDEFLTQFCRRWPLLLTLVLVLALVFGGLGVSFGEPYLIKYDEGDWWSWKQFRVGVALTAVVLMCLLVGFFLRAADRGKLPPSEERASSAGTTTFTRYAISILLCFLVTVFCVLLAFLAIRLLAEYNLPNSRTETLSAAYRLFQNAAIGWPLVGGVIATVGTIPLLARIIDPVVRRFDRVLPSPPRDGTAPTIPRHLVVFLIVLGVFYYILVTGVAVSRYGGGYALGLLVLLLVGTPPLLYRIAPGEVRRLWAVLAENSQALKTAPSGSRGKALFFVLAGTILFVSLANVPSAASPTTIASFLLFGMLVLYGFLSYVFHRSLPVIVAGLAVLFIVGGLNPYKYRFEGMEYKGRIPRVKGDPLAEVAAENLKNRIRKPFDALTADERDRLGRYPLDLQLWSKVDLMRQNAFTDVVREKFDRLPARDDEELAQLKKLYRHNRVLPGKDLRPEAPMGRAREDPDQLLGIDDINLVPRGPLVIVAVSGGGLRAAAWTLRVLQELELAFAKQDSPIDFPSHIRIIAGASGGMLGAAYYVRTLPPPSERRFDRDSIARREQQMREHYDQLTRDWLTPIMKQSVFGDIPLLFSPWVASYDRGKALEDAWHLHLSADGTVQGSPLGITFSRLREMECNNECPSLIFSPMLIEDGGRLLISNLDLRYVASNDGNMLGGADPQVDGASVNYSQEAFEFFRLFPEFKPTLKLSTAVRMSASFPFFSPTVSLPTFPRRRVVDAGYYDNYGVSLGASWLFSRKHQQWIDKKASKVVLIQIRDGLDSYQRCLDEVPAEASSQVSRAFEDLTDPLEGMNSARIASAAFRNDGQLELLSSFYRMSRRVTSGPMTERWFQTVIFEFPQQASLSWYLTPEERRLIDRSARGTEGYWDWPQEKKDALDNAPGRKNDEFRRDDFFVNFRRVQIRIGWLIQWWKAKAR
jgi:hypothetical protein